MVDKLSDEYVAQLKNTFALFDLNGDGKITADEFQSVMKNILEEELSFETIVELFKEVDPHRTGCIDFPNFLQLMAYKMRDVDQKGELRDTFRLFTKGDKITVEDMKNLMTKLGEQASDEEVHEMFKIMHSKEKDSITYDEFVRQMTYAP